MALRNILVVSLGGIIGSLLRWLISLPTHENGRPGGTLIVNFIGAGILIYALNYFQAHPNPRWWWRPAIASGFCGGFTTYSAFAVQIQGYLAENEYGAATLYVLVSLIGTYVVMTVISLIYKRATR
ncbi:unannotated protein [freshwater metagenome]|uniref:Unannotated protein n=1 Tax=freshwater metagenome TaxID=449393 RepID=A0A6J6BLB3_9ZZZZ